MEALQLTAIVYRVQELISIQCLLLPTVTCDVHDHSQDLFAWEKILWCSLTVDVACYRNAPNADGLISYFTSASRIEMTNNFHRLSHNLKAYTERVKAAENIRNISKIDMNLKKKTYLVFAEAFLFDGNQPKT